MPEQCRATTEKVFDDQDSLDALKSLLKDTVQRMENFREAGASLEKMGARSIFGSSFGKLVTGFAYDFTNTLQEHGIEVTMPFETPGGELEVTLSTIGVAPDCEIGAIFHMGPFIHGVPMTTKSIDNLTFAYERKQTS